MSIKSERTFDKFYANFKDAVSAIMNEVTEKKPAQKWRKPKREPTKILSLFNHKGGVSKTTTTFNLGWMLANKGLKVLIVDADPQCNLTGLALGIKEYDDLFDFYNKKNNSNIYDALSGTFGFSDVKVNLDNGVEVAETKHENLKILAGHIKFSMFDLQIATALTSSAALPILRPLIGSINTMVRKTAEKGNFDVVLIDMSPSVSAMNMCMFMCSDYFILPTSPDFYCYQAIDSLSEVFPEWADKLDYFKDGISLPRNNPQMLGVISQNYRVYSTDENGSDDMTYEFKKWADRIKEVTNSKLVPALQDIEMVIDKNVFENNVDYDSPYNLANIQNFNSLVPVSQTKSKPFFEIVQQDANWTGAVWSRDYKGKKVGAEQNVEKSRQIYDQLSDAILGMMDYEKI